MSLYPNQVTPYNHLNTYYCPTRRSSDLRFLRWHGQQKGVLSRTSLSLSPTKRSQPRFASNPKNQAPGRPLSRSEEHTSELQSIRHLVCRLLLEKKTHIELDIRTQMYVAN